MKLCLCCKTKVADKVATCPKCGEASFAACERPARKPFTRADTEKAERELEEGNRPKPKPNPNRKARRSKAKE